MRRTCFRNFASAAALAGAALLSATSAVSQTSVGPGHGYAKVGTGAYSVVAEVQAKPGNEQELLAATIPLVQLVRNDPKNLVYFLQEDREKRGHFVFYEVYATKQDFDAHNNKPYVQSWFAKLPSLAVSSVKITRMEILNEARK